ncbi:MAG: hypothetical protein R2788_14515 [Saprospiraceae bacterium]
MSPAYQNLSRYVYDSTTHLWSALGRLYRSGQLHIWVAGDADSRLGNIITGIESPLWTETITNMDELGIHGVPPEF